MQLNLVLTKKQFKITNQQYEGIANLGPDQAQKLLYKLYQFLTKKKLNLEKRIVPQQQLPLYSKPTASHIAKDRQLNRIVDNNKKLDRTKNLITTHITSIKSQKYNTGLIQWLISKRKMQIQEEVLKQQEQLTRRTKSIANNQNKGQIKEIQLKCFNSSTSKKAKGQQGDFSEAKGILDFLNDSCLSLLKKQPFLKDLKKLGLEIKEKDNETNFLLEILTRFDQRDSENQLKVSPSTLEILINQLSQVSQVNLTLENIGNNFIDFKKYFLVFVKLLRELRVESNTYTIIISLLLNIGEKLQDYETDGTGMMFKALILNHLLQIGNEYPNKRYSICELCIAFTKKSTISHYQLIIKVKELIGQDIKLYVCYLANFINILIKTQGELEQVLWEQLFYYAMNALNSCSPHARANGCKIINELIIFNEQAIIKVLDKLKPLIKDNWWEVKAQALIIFSRLFISKKKNTAEKSVDLNQALTFKTIVSYILEIFKNGVTHNILRIGLIELAELLNYEQALCQRYLDVLLNIGEQIRSDVLNTVELKSGPVVFGSNTFSYRLSGAPLEWNPIGIAKALDENIKRKRLEQMSKQHLEILYSTLKDNKEVINQQVWLDIFKNLKKYLYRALTDSNLCEIASQIIKKIFTIEEIKVTVLKITKEDFKNFLSELYKDKQEKTQKNLLSLFEYFGNINEEYREYIYSILKVFSEQEKDKYLNSNLVDFMNNLARKRRNKLLTEST